MKYYVSIFPFLITNLINKFTGEEAMLQQQLFYDYNGRGHASEFGDTSSTETLGPHNMGDPDLPPRDKDVGISGGQHHMSRSPTRKGKEPLRREKLEIAPLSLPPDLTRGGAQRLLRGRITRLSLKTFLRVFLVAFVFVVFALTCSVIFIFESESSFLQGLRSTREMMLLRIQYYQPLKDHMKSWLGKKSWIYISQLNCITLSSALKLDIMHCFVSACLSQ